MESIARTLWGAICEYGTMKILQSDNGTEFVNSLIKQLTELYGVQHRLITPYHPRANGLVERKNKEISRMIKKYIQGSSGAWEHWLPVVQLALNAKINHRTKSSPFSLMYSRPFNDFVDYRASDSIADDLKFIESRLEKSKELSEVIFPSIHELSQSHKQRMQSYLDHTHKQIDPLLPGTKVMAVDHTKSSKWDPVYEGPYEVVEQHRGGAYSLKDLTGEIMSTKRTIDMLKVIPSLPMAVPSGEGESEKQEETEKG